MLPGEGEGEGGEEGAYFLFWLTIAAIQWLAGWPLAMAPLGGRGGAPRGCGTCAQRPQAGPGHRPGATGGGGSGLGAGGGQTWLLLGKWKAGGLASRGTGPGSGPGPCQG